MLTNPFRQLIDLLPNPPVQVGTVVAVAEGAVHVTLPGGASLLARGQATVGDRVFIRGEVIEGSAPALPIEQIDI